MFDRRFASPAAKPFTPPNAAVAGGARVGQQMQGTLVNTTPGSCGVVSPFGWNPGGCNGRKSVAGIDTSPAPQANAPQGATNTLTAVAANAAFAISFTPYCSMCVSRVYLPPDVAVQVTISAVEIAGQNFLLGGGAVPGDLFAETGADFCCSLIEAQTCSPNNPVILRGNTKNAIPGTLVLRGTLIGSQAVTCP
jgi:hypothetical protein